MMFQRSKTVTVEVLGRVWRFNTPPGSVVLGWAPRVAEISQATDRMFPVDPENYQNMLTEIVAWVRDIDGEAADGLTVEEIDAGIDANEGLHVWVAFFTELNASVIDLGKRETRSESDSRKMKEGEQSTTADRAGEEGLRH